MLKAASRDLKTISLICDVLMKTGKGYVAADFRHSPEVESIEFNSTHTFKAVFGVEYTVTPLEGGEKFLIVTQLSTSAAMTVNPNRWEAGIGTVAALDSLNVIQSGVSIQSSLRGSIAISGETIVLL